MKRLISCVASDLTDISREDLFNSIRESEGRVVLSENICIYEPLVEQITNSELAAGSGADLILLNCFDVLDPKICGLDKKLYKKKDQIIKTLRRLVGCPIGVNLEPVDESLTLSDKVEINAGRKASRATLERLDVLGFDFVCLTGNPNTGVSNKTTIDAIKLARECFSGLIIAGKMHASGVFEDLLAEETILSYIEAGADCILLPAPGTVPGLLEADLHRTVKLIHSKGCLAMGAIGTSQESASPDVIKDIALANKRVGFDIHHSGDGAFSGVSSPEVLMKLSETVKGKRHTYFKLAASKLR